MRTRARTALALLFAATSIGAIASPAAAETSLGPCSGTCAGYDGFDEPGALDPKGAVCKYASDTLDLAKIVVHPPEVWGAYANPTKVGWRYDIYGGPDNLSTPTLVSKSSWQYAKASQSTPALGGHGFSNRTYSVADPHSYEWYRVVVDLSWWHNGAREGKQSFEYDYYKNVDGDSSWTSQDSCSWSGV